MKRHRTIIELGAAELPGTNSIVSSSIIRRRRPTRRAAPHLTTTTIIPLEERTVTLAYISNPRRSIERAAWLQRQDPENRTAHLYGRLFVNEARELYFVQLDGRGVVSLICWLVDKSKRCVHITKKAYHEAQRNLVLLGGHHFYRRCNGAWRVEDLCLDLQSSSRQP